MKHQDLKQKKMKNIISIDIEWLLKKNNDLKLLVLYKLKKKRK
jgi:hypothetical protein